VTLILRIWLGGLVVATILMFESERHHIGNPKYGDVDISSVPYIAGLVLSILLWPVVIVPAIVVGAWQAFRSVK